jgi:MFS family permease
MRAVVSKLRTREIVVTTVILILSFSIYQSFTGFYPTYLIEVKGLSHPTATVLFSFYFSLGIFIQPFSGAVYDRWGIRRALPLFLAVSTLGLVLLPFVRGIYSILGVTVLLSCMLSTIAVTMPYLTTVLPDEIKGTGLGVLRTAYMLFGALSPAVFGVIADLGHFDAGFFLLAALVGVVILLVTLIPTTV